MPVEVGSAYDDDDWGQKIVSFRDFLARIGYDVVPEESDNHSSILSAATAPLYLAQHPLMAQFPALERDFSIPDYVWSSPLAPESMPMYHPPSTKDGFVLNVWIGSGEGQVVSPAHTVSDFISLQVENWNCAF